MKAIVYEKFGPPEVLRVKELPKPSPRDNEVLIRVKATSVTAADCRIRAFRVPFYFYLPMGLMFGFSRPKKPILGFEMAGDVEAVGRDVTLFQEGDRVFGTGGFNFGAYAEYLCLPEKGEVVRMPAGMEYEEAAALSFGGHTALYFLRDKGNIQPGQKVLVYGASGNVGVFAVQLAKYFGAEVTAVCGTSNIELVRSLGADRVIDYTKENFAQSGPAYDIMFETVGKTSFKDCLSVVKDKGVCILANPGFEAQVKGPLVSMTGGKRVVLGTPPESVEAIRFLKELAEEGKIRAVIDKRYTADRIVEAHRYADSGHKKGSVVVTF